MQKILIVEDNEEQLKTLHNSIREKYPDWKIQIAENYQTAKELLVVSLQKSSYFTLFLFDIQLSADNDRDGFTLAKYVRSVLPYFKTPILFLTSITSECNFALSEFHCYNYITKPYTTKTILCQLEQMLFTGYLQNTMEFSDTNRIRHKLFRHDIFAVEAKSHTIILHTRTGSYTTRDFSLESILPVLGNSFFQCHRRYIVNRQYVQCYDKSSKFLLVEDFQIPVGRSYQNIIKNL